VFREEQDVLRTFTQRRDGQRNDRQSMVQITSKPSGTGSDAEVFIRRSDDLDIQELRMCAAEAAYRLFLDGL
jgi:hypothetical protein